MSPAPPFLHPMPKIYVAKCFSEFCELGARLFREAAMACLEAQNDFTAALSGGSTPRPIHQRLGREPYRSELPWNRIHLFWVDERMVDPSDPASNFGTAQSDLLQHIPIPPTHVHPMPVSGPMEKRCETYEAALRRFQKTRRKGAPLFDLVFLGMGADGHVGSLFPEFMDRIPPERLAVSVHGGDPPLPRLSLTLTAINAARSVCFLISGASKASVLRQLLLDENVRLPAHFVHPQGGNMIFLLDKPAAALLPPAWIASIDNKRSLL